MRADLQHKVADVGAVLRDQTKPMKERFRALFTLRNIGGDDAIAYISKVFVDPSALLKHELAYCLGQMGDERALPVLISVLKDVSQEPMVRHEAAEAIGAIGSESGLEVLKQYTEDPSQEVAETCQLALQRIEWVKRHKANTTSPYSSIDPAPSAASKNVEELKSTLLNDEVPLFEKYRAMFALRNINTPESISALCEGLHKGSALFKHEIAFVMGQLQSSQAVQDLINVLEDRSQNSMVRHECAEALGSIATKEAIQVLQKYLKDEQRVVRESCEVALDMADYEMSPEFQYANTASAV